ncbi:MAG: T9SS type A sorting domain-containing protein [Candidatus Eisenbacteria bacterium]
MRAPSLFRTVACLWLCAAPAFAVTTNNPPANQPLTGPSRTLDALAQGYRERSPEQIAALLSADYVFHSIEEGDVRSLFDGHNRADELSAVRGLLQGVKRGEDIVMPAAERVEARIDGVSEQPDPEHPDSTQHYRLVTVRRFELSVYQRGGQRFEISAPGETHVFQMVRGDAAQLAPGQTADPERWYIRGWLDDLSAVNAALSAQKGICGGEGAPPAAGSTAAPAALGIHALANPACAALQVQCDLPSTERARVQVYDASGRLVNERNFEVARASTMTIDAGAGANLTPGVYWVRVAQAKQASKARMVVVAK